MISTLTSGYPITRADRDRWIVERRPQRNSLDPLRPYAFFVEDERSASGEVVSVATIFLTNRECPWRCLMCDLWRNTLETTVAPGAIPAQIDHALRRLPAAREIKLYNSGSFFDFRAIPLADYREIAGQVTMFNRVIVESHPSLVGDNCLRFDDLVCGQLEIAMGLETANPEILERLNKQMTLDQFAAAADMLLHEGIALRVFILVKPPFMREEQALAWAMRSLDFAFECGATAATLIPTRAGNGALDALAAGGDFSPPTLATVEAAAAYGVSMDRGRVFVDLWDLKRIITCTACEDARIERLRQMNLRQIVLAPVTCQNCGAAC